MKEKWMVGSLLVMTTLTVTFLFLWLRERDRDDLTVPTGKRTMDLSLNPLGYHESRLVEEDPTEDTIREEIVERKGDNLTILSRQKNPFAEQVDMVYYINLDAREDRKAEVLGEMARLGIPPTKIHRISGVKDKSGSIGCAKSHLLAMDDAIEKGYNRVMILEDDFKTKYNNAQSFDRVNRFFECGIEFDVLMVVSKTTNWVETPYDFCVRTICSHNTGGYITTKEYLPVLRQNFREARDNLMRDPRTTRANSIDQYWKQLQLTGRWYVITPVLAHQRDGWSDILHKRMEYDDKDEILRKATHYKYALFSRVKTPEDGVDVREAYVEKCPDILMFHWVTDPNLHKDFVVDERDRLIRIKCLPQETRKVEAFYKMLRVVYETLRRSRLMRGIRGVGFCDYHQEPSVEDAMDRFEKQTTTFAGCHVTMTEERKMLESVEALTTYPSLKIHPIIQPKLYTPSGLFYIDRKAVVAAIHHPDHFPPFPTTDVELMAYYDNEKNGFVDVWVDPTLCMARLLSGHGIQPSEL